MCGYSLEGRQSRPARKDEHYVTNMFPGGSIGFASPGDRTTAVCIAADTRMMLHNLPKRLHDRGIVSPMIGTFAELDKESMHRDGFRFENGVELTLQELGANISGWLVDEGVELIAPTTAKERVPVESGRHEWQGKI